MRTIICPNCKAEWDYNTEQAKAIRLKGKDIACLIEAGISLRDENGKYLFYLSQQDKGEE